MSHFEYLVVIMSVVSALAMGHLLLGVSGLVEEREHVVTYLPHSLWVGILFLSILVVWWALWDFRDLAWTFPSFSYVVLGPILQFFAVTLLIPSRIGDGPIDLRSHFQGVRPLFMAVMLGHILLMWVDGRVLLGPEPFGLLDWLHVGWIGCVLVGLTTARDRANSIAASVFALLVLYVAYLRNLPGAFG